MTQKELDKLQEKALAQLKSGESLFGKEGAFAPMLQSFIEAALEAYAGLKIRMRSSGTWRGKDKITKKGRILLRKHLGQTAFSLLRKDRLLEPYYHRELAEGMPAGKAKVACMRKLVKILYGAAKSGRPFNPQRVFRCAG